MSQSSIAGIAFSIIILVAGMTTIYSISTSSATFLTDIVRDTVQKIDKTHNEEFVVDNLIIQDNTIRVNITNIGNTKVPFDKFNAIDFFVLYQNGTSEHSMKITRLNSNISSSYWVFSNVFFLGQKGEYINPINYNQSYGFWDPLEVIEFEIFLDFNYSEIVYVLFCSPNGYMDYATPGKTIDYGSIIVPTGFYYIEVEHHLISIPSNIQLTPKDNLFGNFYWVTNITDTSFFIYLNNPVLSDIEFYWYACLN